MLQLSNDQPLKEKSVLKGEEEHLSTFMVWRELNECY